MAAGVWARGAVYALAVCTSIAIGNGASSSDELSHGRALSDEPIVVSLLNSLAYNPAFYEGQDLATAPLDDFYHRREMAMQAMNVDGTVALYHAWFSYMSVPWWDWEFTNNLTHSQAAAHNAAGFLMHDLGTVVPAAHVHQVFQALR